MVNVFLPTTPNPTSGFLLFVPRKDCIPLDMTVEEGVKLVISGRHRQPARRQRRSQRPIRRPKEKTRATHRQPSEPLRSSNRDPSLKALLAARRRRSYES